MPGFNQSGPEGKGAMTGKQQGMCRRTGDGFPAGAGGGRGRTQGMQRGSGEGRGQGRRPGSSPGSSSSAPVAGNELESLKKAYEEAVETVKELEAKIAALENNQ